MAKPHFLIRRSRSGRFNFTLLASQGRITGVVTIATVGRTKDDIEGEAREKVRALADVLAHAVCSDDGSMRDADPDPRQVMRESCN
ncbi:hypothetical protein [uncultured Methylobacterium sp.]|uniref:hypothetical protein n=1 Tax=uncultured Methylobacterium sp. TaxID=157278 RepID=UPI0035C9A257